MTISLDLSGKIEPLLVEFFETLQRVATATGTPYFVVGALARDLILERGFGLASGRATNDVDVGVCVPHWGAFQRWTDQLLATGDLEKDRPAHRFVYRRQLWVDMLPFGPVAAANHTVHWPPDFDFAMSTVGFEEAFNSALHVKVKHDPPLEILVASPAGLAMMKLVAWSERPHERSRDAFDLARLLSHYLDAGNHDRFLEEHGDLVEVENFDYVKAGARLLGRDIARIARPDTKRRLLSILESETKDQTSRLLATQMISPALSREDDDKLFTENLNLLRELKTGVQES